MNVRSIGEVCADAGTAMSGLRFLRQDLISMQGDEPIGADRRDALIAMIEAASRHVDELNNRADKLALTHGE